MNPIECKLAEYLRQLGTEREVTVIGSDECLIEGYIEGTEIDISLTYEDGRMSVMSDVHQVVSDEPGVRYLHTSPLTDSQVFNNTPISIRMDTLKV